MTASSPSPQPYHARPAAALPKQAYTRWRTRVVAALIDWTPIWVIFLIPLVGLVVAGDAECLDSIYGSGQSYCSTAVSDFWTSVQFIAVLPGVVYFIWNFCYRQGATGQSIGKSVMKFYVVSAETRQPIGFWMSLIRQIAHYVDQILCCVGYLWPLWDKKRQTLADKIVGTVCLPLGAGPTPPPQWIEPPGPSLP
ncbi:RDD family protein [Mycolicibacterium tusciae]|uniref:Transporter n=1 Tax=Mycolicibacterium tusciae TaxID=75922 RepID=A0A1X0JMZ9_9MYCO|nr:RDD family protein [Mycolicibacterium tusciae]ORB64313.1 transporter [Mycolicibacterium tusciae]